MGDIVDILLVGIGLPVLGLTIITTTLILRTWWVKSKELKLKEEQMRLDAKERQDQTNQQIIESHSHSISAREIQSILDEIKELRNEMIRVKADVAAANGRSLVDSNKTPKQRESSRNMSDENV